VTLPNYPFSMNDPWLAAGSTQTIGNNVNAFADLQTPDNFTPVQEPPVDPPLGDHHAFTSAVDSFIYTHQPDVDAFSANARQASITQLFYNINFLHDWYYDSGFNEVSGNAQTNNFGRGGLGAGSIKGKSQDFQSFRNANTLTPGERDRFISAFAQLNNQGAGRFAVGRGGPRQGAPGTRQPGRERDQVLT